MSRSKSVQLVSFSTGRLSNARSKACIIMSEAIRVQTNKPYGKSLSLLARGDAEDVEREGELRPRPTAAREVQVSTSKVAADGTRNSG
jgi:hypothetical protein